MCSDYYWMFEIRESVHISRRPPLSTIAFNKAQHLQLPPFLNIIFLDFVQLENAMCSKTSIPFSPAGSEWLGGFGM